MPDKVLAFYIRLSSEDRDLKTDILKTADSTPLENLVMFRIVDPLKVILVALDERIEISGVHGLVSLFYIW